MLRPVTRFYKRVAQFSSGFYSSFSIVFPHLATVMWLNTEMFVIVVAKTHKFAVAMAKNEYNYFPPVSRWIRYSVNFDLYMFGTSSFRADDDSLFGFIDFSKNTCYLLCTTDCPIHVPKSCFVLN